MQNLVQVYSPVETSRLSYAVDVVLGNILGLKYRIISEDPDPELPLINYSYDRSIGGIYIKPEKILFEEDIRVQDIWVAHLDNTPFFFQQPPEAGFILDIFAFAFYNCSRYEEYLPFMKDAHGRFAAESSKAYKHDFLYKPVVDIWSIKLGHTIKMLWPDIKMPKRKYDYLLTIDVDQPFAYRGKGILRNLGGLAMDIYKGRKPGSRLNCITGSKPDPYDTFNYIISKAREQLSKVFFFYTAGKRSKYDKNPNPLRKCYRRLIHRLGEESGTGLHPSYISFMKKEKIIAEKERLEKASGREIDISRQHFLLLRFPETYQILQEAGIKTDYSLGYVREAGFRAGIARPFRFYDLSKGEATGLTIVPFQYMDGTLQQFKRMTIGEAKELVLNLITETKNVGGLFISVWHNTSLTEEGNWKGWKEVFEYTLAKQKR